MGLSFQVLELSESNCVFVGHQGLGNPGAALAVTGNQVFYTASNLRTGKPLTLEFDASDLAAGRATGKAWVGMASDLRGGVAYVCAHSGTAITTTAQVDSLLTLDSATSAAHATGRINLSQPISVVAGQTGIFSGPGGLRRRRQRLQQRHRRRNPGGGVACSTGQAGVCRQGATRASAPSCARAPTRLRRRRDRACTYPPDDGERSGSPTPPGAS